MMEVIQLLELAEEDISLQRRSQGNTTEPGVTALVPALGIVAVVLVTNPNGTTIASPISRNGDGSLAGYDLEKGILQSVSVPGAIVQQLGQEAVISMSLPRLSILPKSISEELLVVPVSLNVKSFASTTRLKKLEEPLVLTFDLANKTETPQCSFWDLELNSWSSEGISTHATKNGQVECTTYHLSFFGVIAGNLGNIIMCSNVDVLSAKKLANIPKGSWWHGPAAIVLFIAILAQVPIFFLAVWQDLEMRKCGNWSEEAFMADEKIVVEKPHGVLNKLLFAIFLDEHIDSEIFSRNAIKVVTHVAISYQLWVYPADVKFLMREHNRSRRWYPESLSKSPVVPEVHDRAGEAFKYFYDDCDFLSQVRIIWLALHPLSAIMMKSFTMSSKIRGLLLTSRLLGSLATSGLFFYAAGEAPSVVAPPECAPPSDIWESLPRDMLVGLMSAFIGKLPLILVHKFHRRRFHYPGSLHVHREILHKEWTTSARRKHVVFIHFVDAMLAAYCICYSLACSFFCVAFLANVMVEAQKPYIISFCTYLIQSFVIAPLMVAVGYVYLAHQTIWWNAHAFEASRMHFDLHRLEELEKTPKVLPEDASHSVVVQESTSLREQGAQPVQKELGLLVDDIRRIAEFTSLAASRYEAGDSSTESDGKSTKAIVIGKIASL